MRRPCWDPAADAEIYETAGLHSIWEGDRQALSALTERYHQPLAKILFDTEIYLKLPSAGRLGREFTVYIGPHGRARANQCPKLWIGLLRCDFPGPLAHRSRSSRSGTLYLHYLLIPWR